MSKFRDAVNGVWSDFLAANGFDYANVILTETGEHHVFSNESCLLRFSKDYLGIDTIRNDIQVSFANLGAEISALEWHPFLRHGFGENDWVYVHDFAPRMTEAEYEAFSACQLVLQQEATARVLSGAGDASTPSDKRSLQLLLNHFIDYIVQISTHFRTQFRS